MQNKLSEKKRFTIVGRMRSMSHAFRGLWIIFKTGHSIWIGCFFAAIAIFLSFILKISEMEWIVIIFCIGITLSAEGFNTAIEIDIDLTSPEYHPYARDTKDVAAGAVIIVSIMSGIIGFIIFLPKILNLLV
ncbi:MAG: diacylglycerol kinase family protein [Candidatus Paceibacterota bacterium]|jgi:diacylglycerol kinase